METILIDDLVKNQNVSEEVIVIANGQRLKGWKIAKPLNYNKKYTSFISRLRMALLVFNGKAIAVQYFRDLSEEEKTKYVESELKYEKQ